MGFIPVHEQIGSPDDSAVPYTGNPLTLLQSDVVSFFTKLKYLPVVLQPAALDVRDELYLSLRNLNQSIGNYHDVFLHSVLFAVQAFFLSSLVFCAWMPFAAVALYFAGFIYVNWMFCYLLNGNAKQFYSTVNLDQFKPRPEEHWMFLNGVSVGKHWLQNNIDRLSITFGRKIEGVHNPTAGIIFDILECLIQRNFSYATQDVRTAYLRLKDTLYDEKIDKVVFIVHSQGGIEGGMIVDWLLAEVPQNLLSKLEVYSFGNAANHWNNPYRDVSSLHSEMTSGASPGIRRATTFPLTEPKTPTTIKAIRHIEHYVNQGDFVAQWGGATRKTSWWKTKDTASRFMGMVFESPGTGHLLNQHYLNYMFTLGADGKVAETNEFMEMLVDFDTVEEIQNTAEIYNNDKAELWDASPISPLMSNGFSHRYNIPIRRKVGELSRLWQYRNGRTPLEQEPGSPI